MDALFSWQLAVEHSEDLKRASAPRDELREAHRMVMIKWMKLHERRKT